jgi:hypothetical protein
MNMNRKIIDEIATVFISQDRRIFSKSFLLAWDHPRVISKLRLLGINNICPRYLFSLLDSERKGFITVTQLREKLEKMKRGTPLLPMKIMNDQLAHVYQFDVSPASKSLSDLNSECLTLARQSTDEIVQKRLSGHVIRNFFP